MPKTSLRLGELLLQEGLIRPEDLDRALEMQRRTGSPLGQILIALGLVRRYDLYRLLARQWNLPFRDLLQDPPDPEVVRLGSPEQMLREGYLPLEREGNVWHIATARRPTPEREARIREQLGIPPDDVVQFYVTTDWDIEQVIRDVFREEVIHSTVLGLYYRRPHESAYTVLTRGQFAVLALGLLSLILALWWAPYPTLLLLNACINIGFLAGIAFKFVVSLVGATAEQWEPITQEDLAALRDEDLPRYTILVPVYREANVIRPLLESLSKLDYPRDKLEILVLIEEDDEETLAAAKAARPPYNVRFIRIPDSPPKTKPKACNVGLFFARGEFLVIYDAEDRPEPDQLKKAVAAFRKGPPNLAVVQAALNYYNRNENFLTRMFTLEYSYWFDYMLPGLARLGLPIPLGGTSNHFRTQVLRELGGWDPFNVTEDADLGIRAAMHGYRVSVINSTTYEEANSRVGNWIRQRSRWIKGYMQTALVHLRSPRKLVRCLGWKGTMGFLFLIVGTPLTFLSAPWMWVMYIVWLLTRTELLTPLFPPAVLSVSLFNLLIGNGLAIYLNMMAMFKRKYYDLIGWALLNPAYWVLHSIAAYKALWQLLVRPHYWEKTVHGLTRYETPALASESSPAA
ncbi:MAG: glycosyltransferase [Chloroflexi bacterium]|nr:glycosyltransferase [Chloroflexota bacterium]